MEKMTQRFMGFHPKDLNSIIITSNYRVTINN